MAIPALQAKETYEIRIGRGICVKCGNRRAVTRFSMYLKKLLIPILLLALTDGSVYCQRVYFKVSPGYNIAVSTQKIPDYLSHQVEMGTSSGFQKYNINLNVNKFSVASGLNLQVAAGYPLNDFISFEIRFSAFTNSRKKFDASPPLGTYGKTEWDLKSYSLLPTVLFGQTFNKATVNIFAWSGVGATNLNIITSYREDYREFEFDRQATFSWGYGLEFSYVITGKYSLFTNIGINNSYYSPEKAHMISSYYPPAYLNTYQKEIEYVDEIRSLQLGSGGVPVSGPEIRLKETLRSHSLSLGIGIKYTPWK